MARPVGRRDVEALEGAAGGRALRLGLLRIETGGGGQSGLRGLWAVRSASQQARVGVEAGVAGGCELRG